MNWSQPPQQPQQPSPPPPPPRPPGSPDIDQLVLHAQQVGPQGKWTEWRGIFNGQELVVVIGHGYGKYCLERTIWANASYDPGTDPRQQRIIPAAQAQPPPQQPPEQPPQQPPGDQTFPKWNIPGPQG